MYIEMYVHPAKGSDDFNGTQSHPYKTVEKAVKEILSFEIDEHEKHKFVIKTGDGVNVIEHVLTLPNISDNISIVFKPYDDMYSAISGVKPIYDSNGVKSQKMCTDSFFEISASHVHFNGIDFEELPDIGCGFLISDCTDISFDMCSFKNMKGNVIKSNNCKKIDVTDCIFENAGDICICGDLNCNVNFDNNYVSGSKSIIIDGCNGKFNHNTLKDVNSVLINLKSQKFSFNRFENILSLELSNINCISGNSFLSCPKCDADEKTNFVSVVDNLCDNEIFHLSGYKKKIKNYGDIL